MKELEKGKNESGRGEVSCLTVVPNLSCLWNVAYEMENQEFKVSVF